MLGSEGCEDLGCQAQSVKLGPTENEELQKPHA